MMRRRAARTLRPSGTRGTDPVSSHLKRLRLLLPLLLGCVRTDRTPPYRTTSPTHEALRAFASQGPQGASVRLAAVTPFVWDVVHAFPTGTSWEQVRERSSLDTSGQREARYLEPGPLLVFVRDDRVVSSLALTPPVQVGVDSVATFPASTATIRAHSKPPAPHTLLLAAADTP
ncbi:MAG: hypothetical protein ACI8S6_004633 [Myxococcota bacterium]|jgi:hypothetical protein